MLSFFIFFVGFVSAFKILIGSVKKVNPSALVSFFSFVLMLCFVLWKLGKFPNVFIDEGNCAYDSWCIAHYGVDSNLIHNPVYLQSFAGQGQSVLYAYLAAPFLKYLGYSFFNFRLPLVIFLVITVLNFLRIINTFYPVLLPFISVVLCTCPYLLTQSRYGMDCNIAFWVMLGAISIFLDALNTKKEKTAVLKYTLSFIVLGLTAYSYNVSWFYLPILVMFLAYMMLKKGMKAILFIPFGILVLEVLPILTFAVRSNYEAWNKTKKFLFFTSPKLQVGRASASLIHPITVRNVVSNIILGFKQLFLFGDGLSWNSLPSFSGFYFFAFVLFFVGFIYTLRNIKIEINQVFVFLFCSNLFICCIVKPNFNHWMFIFLPVIYFISCGLICISNNREYISRSLFCLYLFSFIAFTKNYYQVPRYTGMSMDTTSNISRIERRANNHSIFIQSKDQFLMQALRDFKPCSPYEYQATKDNPYSKTHLQAYDNFKNFHRISKPTKYVKGSLILTNDHRKFMKNARLLYSHIAIGSQVYNVFEVR